MGGAVLVNLILTYLKQTHGLDEDAANSTNLVMLVVIVLANVLAIIPSRAAVRSDRAQAGHLRQLRHRRRRASRWPHSRRPIPFAIVGGALFGASAGTFLAVDWALMTDIIPKASSGRYMGLSNVATTSSTVIAVATAGLLLDAVNIEFGLGLGPAGRVPPRRCLLRGRGAHAAAGRRAAAVRASSRRYAHGTNAHR